MCRFSFKNILPKQIFLFLALVLCQLLALPAVSIASGCVTLCTLPYLALPCHMAPESAYSFAFDTLDYLATK